MAMTTVSQPSAMTRGNANGPPQPDESNTLTPSQIGILQLNALTYKLEPDLAVVLQRNIQTSFFQTQAYSPGTTLQCTLNTGSSFINLRQSYLILDVQNASSGLVGTDSSNAWFGLKGGSAANFIDSFTIFAKNGVVLERIDNANQLAASKICYQYSQTWLQSVGSAMGIAPNAATLGWNSGTVAAPATGRILRFAIPLYVFSTLCDTMTGLCPPQLLAGARIDIVLASAAEAMMDETNAAKLLNYSIVGCKLDLESYLLTDSVMKVINQTAATVGLDVVCSTTQNTQAQRTSSQLSMDVARSCSRALAVVIKERVPPGAAAVTCGFPSGALFDNMASAPICEVKDVFINFPLEFQIRAGQLYFPQTSIRGSGTNQGQAEVELYLQTLRAFQKLNPGQMGQGNSSNTSIFNFRGVSPATNGGAAVYALDLQRSAILTSGIPLMNSRQLNILYNTKKFQLATFAYLVDVFLTYQINIRTFISQCVVEV